MSHRNTLFAETLSLIPRHVFQKLEQRHKTGRASRKFGFKEQFTAMAFIILAARRSMRDGLRCLDAAKQYLYHWGLKKISRSTFADANKSRPVEFYKDLFGEMFNLCHHRAPKHKFSFKSKLYSLDATIIKLCLSIFPWASYRSRKGGIKMHTLLDHDGYIPTFITVTEARKHESKVAKTLNLPKDSIVIFDRGYNDYNWFRQLGEKGIYFVTRLKENARYRVRERYHVDRKSGVTSDQLIEISNKDFILCLRRVGYYDKEQGKHYEFLTNRFDLPAKTIADIYKDRWSIEIFFREIKQNLHIKAFIGTSENAVLIQLYTALTLYLLIAYQKFLSHIGISIQQILQLLQINLMERVSLDELLAPPKPKIQSGYSNSLLSLVS